ncbi:zinc finger protein 394 isoform X1 [Nasonia vitripennis]|uniref:C2H2-type domain-containing protein n=1 Tax=Nasonia vitripennis TaxID=7425 RepID=A0A7M7GCC8_NASVI|nr:zinc finger protein 394 isoform X1 [Nasonia vitripennis]XP_003424525.1 zinc finger protein 394 isoform X1 [Nasonia vitripennis]XP_008217205.1 zinc finger protein 394 isoform X1 [Nasonia vitripennis]XP_016844734.1 zinc finger protein 394 isoform X1 [Nasonia vitripennis]XP_032456160.1 zinc finger protein 394 isoform X1 [Nasonia vitripennis]
MEVDTNVCQILEQADEGEEIILEPEGGCEEGEEIEEIVEIIEEIEEVEENEEVGDVEELEEVEQIEQLEEEEEIQEAPIVKTTNGTYVHKENYMNNNQKNKVNTIFQQPSSSQEKSNIQVHYDASADWEDDEYEQEEQDNSEEHIVQESASNSQDFNTYATYSNGGDGEIVHTDEGTQNSQTQDSYEHSLNQENSVDSQQHKIVQNPENNLIYTVLEPKKQAKQASQDTRSSDLEFVEVQRYKDENLPEDGTIYYAVNDDGTYVQAVEGNQQYQFVNQEQMETENQEWEAANQNAEEQPEQAEQDQIFLHEDEDGQLYFKNEHGQLQPVYLTPDGSYAIVENSSDEQDSQEGPTRMEEEPVDTDNYVLPDLDLKPYTSSKKQRLNDPSQDDDDSTVTISLIISEDENGQKRTQVIIPTAADSKCNICNKTFKTSLQLLKHNRLKHAREEDITTRNFPCDLCPKRFTDQNSLARHRKTHTEARPFQCLECHKSFPTANTLRKHLAMHNPDSQPLPCIYCGRRFSDKISLQKHEQSHLAGEKRTHVCDICQKCFSNINDLNIHKKNHDPDRKFDCEVCGREFNRLNNLQRHMMVHQQQGANEEILSCNVCGITYKFSSSLTRHMVTTHMNPEKLRQQAEEQRRKRESNYRRYLENRKTYETQQPKRPYRRSTGRLMDDQDDDEAD